MNKERRKAIDAALKGLAVLATAIEALPDIDDLKAAVEAIAEGEQECYENMPENMQSGEKGEAASEAMSNLEDAVSELDELGLGDLAEKVAEIVAKLETARDGG